MKQKRGKRMIAGMLSMILFAGSFSGSLAGVKASDVPEDTETQVDNYLDFDNLPAVSADDPLPEIGLGEELVGNDASDTSEIEFSKLLIESAVSWAVGKGLDFGSDKLLSAIFGSGDSELKKQLDQVLANQEKIMDMLKEISNLITKLNYKEQLQKKYDETEPLYVTCKNTTATISKKTMTKEDRMKTLQDLYVSTDKNSYVNQVITLYNTRFESPYLENKNIFSTYDAYMLYNFIWENEGYNIRESSRKVDSAVFMQLWTLAYASCEAHIQGDTKMSEGAKYAQKQLMDCISNTQKGTGENKVMGLGKLLETYPVTRAESGHYTFQVPGSRKELYIPDQSKISSRYTSDTAITKEFTRVYGLPPKTYTKKILGSENEMYWSIQDDRRIWRPTVNYSELEKISQYYKDKSKESDIRKILYGVTNDKAFTNYKDYPLGFLHRRGFHTERDSGRDYYYSLYTTEKGTCRAFKAYMYGDAGTGLRRCLGLYITRGWLGVYDANGTSSMENPEDSDSIIQTDSLLASEGVTDQGVLTDVKEDGTSITLDITDTEDPFSEEILLNSETVFADGSAVDTAQLKKLLNSRVEITSAYTIDEDNESMAFTAKSIKVLDDSGVTEVSGSIVSSVGSAVIVKEDDGSTVGYLLPDVKEDIPLGTHITIRYQWKDGERRVDSFELKDNPADTPAAEQKED